MADLRPQRRIEGLEGDREALEHIARALEGRVVPLPGAAALPEPEAEAVALTLDPASLKTLLEAMPAAIGILARDALDLREQRVRLCLRLSLLVRAAGGGWLGRDPAERRAARARQRRRADARRSRR